MSLENVPSSSEDSILDEDVLPADLSDVAGVVNDLANDAALDLDIGEFGIIARLLRGCLDLFESLIQECATVSMVCRKDENVLRRSCATLKLWGNGHGVSEGKLDQMLERSKDLQHTTLSTLNSLCGVLLNGLCKIILSDSHDTPRSMLLHRADAQILYDQTRYILADSDENASDSESDSDLPFDELTKSRLAAIVGEIKTYINCLVDLNAALECPAMDPEYRDKPTIPRLEERAAYEYYADLIISKYPNAGSELVDCLGKANWSRYQRMQARREHNANTRAGQAQSATSKSCFGDSEFKDSGLGTSMPSQSATYAETFVSYMSSISGGQKIQIPPLPAEGKRGEKFECSACGDDIMATTNREWRKHLFSDIQPYTCFRPHCSFSAIPFANRHLWSDHLDLEHKLGPQWESEQCPLCLELTGSGKSTILNHFARHMEDIALASLPRGIDSETNSEVESDTTSDNDSAPGIHAASAQSGLHPPSLPDMATQDGMPSNSKRPLLEKTEEDEKSVEDQKDIQSRNRLIAQQEASIAQEKPKGQAAVREAQKKAAIYEPQQRATVTPGALGQPLTEQVRLSLLPPSMDHALKAQMLRLPEAQFRSILAGYAAYRMRLNQAKQTSSFPRGKPTPIPPKNTSQGMTSSYQRLAQAQQLLQQHAGIIAFMDNRPFPPTVLNNQMRQIIPPDVKTWVQLKQWVAKNSTHKPSINSQKLLLLQALHFQEFVQQQQQQQRNKVSGTHPPLAANVAGLGQPAQMIPGIPAAPPPQHKTQGVFVQPPQQMPNIANLGPIQVTPQEIQQLRSRLPPAQAGVTDAQLRSFIQIQKMKRQQPIQSQQRNQGQQPQNAVSGVGAQAGDPDQPQPSKK